MIQTRLVTLETLMPSVSARSGLSEAARIAAPTARGGQG